MAELDHGDSDRQLRQELAAICGQVSSASEPVCREATERLIALGRAHPPEQLERLIVDGALLEARAQLAPAYVRDVRRREIEAAQRMLASSAARLEGLGEFAQSTYSRVVDMFDHLDFRSCTRFVMVGAGPLPATLWHVRDQTAVPNILGLDVDAEAVTWGRQVLRAIDPTRMRLQCQAGEQAHFGEADIIYVANLISRKAEVLERIAETARPGTQVALRDPFSVGLLLAERGAEVLAERFSVTGQGTPGLRFYSQHVFATVV
ncbi:MAG: hypothetical protein JRI68_24530 [Deltaproteobacteria bacterium]|nr:hypothetical protein [Deltaproteobacteria bacterium]